MGETVTVAKLHGEGPVKRRIMDIVYQTGGLIIGEVTLGIGTVVAVALVVVIICRCSAFWMIQAASERLPRKSFAFCNVRF